MRRPVEWLVCDFGLVLSLPPSARDRARLERATGMSTAALWPAYWRDRLAYDRADLSSSAYWTAILGAPPATRSLEALVRADAALWSRPRRPALAAIECAARVGRWRLAVLSNMPRDVADSIERLAWLGPFERLYFSGRLGLVKPETAIYTHVLSDLACAPEAALFIDDREENVAAAVRVGLGGHVFRTASALRRFLAAAA